MVGGRGWDNDDYLSGLGGNEEDRRKVQEDYEDFAERRAAFEDRQKELMKNSEAREFFKRQQQQQQQSMDGGFDDDSFGDSMPDIQPGSGGGSRMAQMMAQAKRMGQPQPKDMMFGLQQKFAPLDSEEEEETEEWKAFRAKDYE